MFSLDVSAADVDSTLDTVDGFNILLNKEGDLVVGRVDAANDGDVDNGDAIAFAISIDGSTGIISVAQYLAIAHPLTGLNGTNHNDILSISENVLLAVATATDGDGDTSTASTGIGDAVKFRDDGPMLSTIANGSVEFASGDSTGDTGFLNYGTDGAGGFIFTSFEAAPDDTILGAMTETLSGDSQMVTYTSAIYGDVFKVTLDETAPGSYTFMVLQDAPLVLNALDFATVSPGGPKELEVITGEGSTVTTFNGFLFDNTSFDNEPKPTITLDDGLDGTDDDVNISTPGIGLDDNQMDIDEGLELSFSNDVEGVQLLIQGGTGKNAPFDIRFIAYDDGAEVDDSTFTNIPMPNGNDELLYDYLPGVSFDTLEVYIDFDNPKGGLRIKEVSLFERLDIPDFSFDYEVKATDGDGDMATAGFTVDVDSDGDEIITLDAFSGDSADAIA